jgi:hypothetical protein
MKYSKGFSVTMVTSSIWLKTQWVQVLRAEAVAISSGGKLWPTSLEESQPASRRTPTISREARRARPSVSVTPGSGGGEVLDAASASGSVLAWALLLEVQLASVLA